MKPVNVTDSSFQSEVLENDTLVLVDFWAPWCGPCRAISPVLDETAANWAGRLKVVKIDIDENRKTASDYSVTSIPTLSFFKGGQVVDRMTGWIPASQLSIRIERLLAPPVRDLSPFQAGKGVQ